MNSSPSAQLRSASSGLVLLARAGYAAKGIVYIVIGSLAANAAVGHGGGTTDPKGAVRFIGDGPFGKIALVIIGVGLLGYMAWRLISAATDAERKGNDPTSLAKRVGEALRGIGYGALGIYALKQLTTSPSQGGNGTRHWTAKLLDLPFGRFLVMAVGLGVIGFACYQLYRAGTDKLKKHLDLAEAGEPQATWIVRAGRFGIGARAVVFAMIGVLLLRAAAQHNAGEAGGIAQGLAALAAAPYGRYVYGAVALGFVAYGLFQLATARYRHIRAT